jgi:hypothetical protein
VSYSFLAGAESEKESVMNPPPHGSGARVADVALVVLFVTAISLPLLFSMLGLNFQGLAENRTRATRPVLKLERETLARFPGKFEAYFNDAFGLRDQLIRWNNLTRVSLLRVSPSSKVLIGDRGWLFYAAEGAIDDLRHNHPLTGQELEQWRRVLEERRDWLARKGVRYLVMFAPNKHTIYPEYVPKTYDRVSPDTRYDQLYRYLREQTNLDLVDLREPLLKAKSRARLYYRRDTHWNDRGAFVAYQAIMEKLSGWFPALRPKPWTAFHLVHYVEPNPDLSLMLGLGEVLPDQEYTMQPRFPRRAQPADAGPGLARELFPDKPPEARECPDAGLPRAVVFRDSFSSSLIPLLSEHFSRSLYLWHCPFDTAIIEREHPQVVIEEAVERRLWAPPPVPGLPEAMIARK